MRPLLDPKTTRSLLGLIWPVLLEQFLLMFVGFADTWLAGRFLETPHLAAMNLMSYVLWFFSATCNLVSVGAVALVARFVGAGRRRHASLAANQALLLALALGALQTCLAVWVAPQLLEWSQLPASSTSLALDYLRIMTPAIPFLVVDSVLLAAFRGAGQMVLGLISMVLVNIVNVVVSTGLLTGAGPFPKLGWDGLAIGTLLGHIMGGIFAIGLLASGHQSLRLRLRWLVPRWDYMHRILRVGVPAGVDSLAIVCCHLSYVGIINSLGENIAAAHGVAVKIESLSYLPGTAFQLAAMTLVGQRLGARRHDEASTGLLTACVLGLMFQGTVAVGILAFAHPLAAIFLKPSQTEVRAITVLLLQMVAFAIPQNAISMTVSGGLRGAGETRWPLLVNLFGLAALRLPLSWCIAYPLGFGIRGVYLGMIADLSVRAGLLTWRAWEGSWKGVKV